MLGGEHQEEKPVDLDLQSCRSEESSQCYPLLACAGDQLSLQFFVLLCCPTLKGQKAQETGEDDSGVEETEEGKQSHADFSFFTSDAQILPIFILSLSCFHCADTNPP